MTDITALPISPSIRAVAPPAAEPAAPSMPSARLRAYLDTEGDDLLACADWLGGPRWRGLAEQLCVAMSSGGKLRGWTRSLLEAVHRLLSLEYVDDAEASEAGRFVCLDLADPRVERCCRHAEALGDIVAALRRRDVALQRARQRHHRPRARAA